MPRKKTTPETEPVIEVTAETLPVIIPVDPIITNRPVDLEWNMAAVQEYLEAVTSRYANLIVTDENFDEMTKVKTQVVHLRTSLSKFETQGKSILKKPVNNFTSEVKKLYEIIAKVERPLVDQLQVYDDKRIADITAKINGEIDKKAAAAALNPDYLVQLFHDPKWLNKTQDWKDTCISIDQEIARVVAIQRADEDRAQLLSERRELATTYIDLANAQYSLKTPLKAEKLVTDDLLEKTIGEIKQIIFDAASIRKSVEDTAASTVSIPVAEVPVKPPMPTPTFTPPAGPPPLPDAGLSDMVVTIRKVSPQKIEMIYQMLDSAELVYDAILKEPEG